MNKLLVWGFTLLEVQQQIEKILNESGLHYVSYTEPVCAADGSWISIVRVHAIHSTGEPS